MPWSLSCHIVCNTIYDVVKHYFQELAQGPKQGNTGSLFVCFAIPSSHFKGLPAATFIKVLSFWGGMPF